MGHGRRSSIADLAEPHRPAWSPHEVARARLGAAKVAATEVGNVPEHVARLTLRDQPRFAIGGHGFVSVAATIATSNAPTAMTTNK
jgi:hypothetical protein